MDKNYIIASFLLLTIVAAIGCTPTGNVTREEPIRIGVVAILSGDYAQYGLASKAGIDEAVRKINEQGGVDGRMIELIYEDSQADAQKAVAAYQSLAPRVDAMIIADGSGATSAVAPLADQDNLLTMGVLGSAPNIASQAALFFRTVPADNAQGVAIAHHAEQMDLQNAAVLYIDDAYGQGIADIFMSTFTGSTKSYAFTGTDVRTQLLKIKQQDPDVLILVSRTETPNILKQMQELGLSMTIIGSETIMDTDSILAAGDAAMGVYAVFFAEQEDGQGFRDTYLAYHGTEAPVLSEYGYDGVVAYAAAVKKAGSTDAYLVAAELHVLSFHGASGPVAFDAYGDVSDKPIDLFRYDGESFVRVEE